MALRPMRLLPPRRLLTPRSARHLSMADCGLLPHSGDYPGGTHTRRLRPTCRTQHVVRLAPSKLDDCRRQGPEGDSESLGRWPSRGVGRSDPSGCQPHRETPRPSHTPRLEARRGIRPDVKASACRQSRSLRPEERTRHGQRSGSRWLPPGRLPRLGQGGCRSGMRVAAQQPSVLGSRRWHDQVSLRSARSQGHRQERNGRVVVGDYDGYQLYPGHGAHARPGTTTLGRFCRRR